MALAEGTKLGPYEILGPAGAGGMGEVYKANDTRLGRTVAIKVLPGDAAARSDLRERLAREAKAVSSLNHPNICALYDVGHQDGTDYLVMEFLEGETLAGRLDQGPIPTKELFKIAIEIADGLAAAHRQGLVHRDLKPGNVMLTSSGAKLLDFGLAKSLDRPVDAGSLTAAPTATSPLTTEGTVVGTFQYLAPEQLEGGAADARSDIFAFGTVLYEMATGRRPFDGKTQASLAASILKETPRPITELTPMTPPGLQRLVSTCLEKDPEHRRQTMNDVLLDLRWLAEGGSEAGLAAPVSRRRKARSALLAAAAAAATIAALVFAALWWQAASVPRTRVVSSILGPPEAVVYPEDGFALSPDGSMLVYSASVEAGRRSLWLRRLNEAEPSAIPGTVDAVYPFWSPDSRHIGFFAGGKLKRIDALGGATQALADASSARGGTWSSQGLIVYAPRFQGPMFRIDAAGGESRALTEMDSERGETSHRWPWFLPDGRHLIFLSQTGEGGVTDDRSRIESLDVETGERRVLFLANSSVHYTESGHVLFWRQGAVVAQPFDAGQLSLAGDLFQVVDQVQYTINELAEISVDQRGNLIYQAGQGVEGLTRPVWKNREGEDLEEVIGEGAIFDVQLSPGEDRVAYVEAGDIRVLELQRQTSTRLTFHEADDYTPIWSPDGVWIAYASVRDGEGLILRRRTSGLGDEEILYRAGSGGLYVSDWSPDGRSLLLGIQTEETGWDLATLPLDGDEPRTLVATSYLDLWGKFSRDGGWLVYVSDESVRTEVFVLRLTEPGGRWQISSEGGVHPRWRADGKELYFMTADGSIKSVSLSLGGEFEAGVPVTLFQAPFRRGMYGPYDASADGTRFIANVFLDKPTFTPLMLVQNWSAGLTDR